MKMSPSIASLAPALVKALGALSDVTKSGTATVETRKGGQYSYKYADLADVMKIARPILHDNGLALMQFPRPVDGGIEVETALMHTTGEWIADSLAFPSHPAMSSTEYGSLISYIRKYAAMAILGMASDDDDAGNAARARERAEPRGRKPREAGAPVQAPAQAPAELDAKAKADRIGKVETWEKSIREANDEETLVFRYKRAYGEVHAMNDPELTRRIIAAKDGRKTALGIAGKDSAPAEAGKAAA